MKTLILASALVISSAVFACDQQEAQFIGKVRNYSVVQNGNSRICTFEIDYSMFNYSQVCPLDEGEVAGIRFSDSSCSMKDGDQVSGIMVKKGDSVYIE